MTKGAGGADLEAVYQAILTHPTVLKALTQIEADDALTLEKQKRITEIPAPSFKEAKRAAYYLDCMRELGLADARIDSEGNVVGLRKGIADGPKLVVSAHLDTVFGEDEDVTVSEKDGIVLGPGIGDDGRGLAALLAVLSAMNTTNLRCVGDILFVATVGEEGLGDLRGAKALFRDHKDIDGFISIDELGIDRIVTRASGSKRYEISFAGPGGHSYDDFGRPSAIHAMSRAIAKISDLRPPTEPKTTFTVGKVESKGTVNAIAADATMLVDIRSSEADALSELETNVLKLVNHAVAEENERWLSDKMISLKVKPIGDRPPGMTPEDSVIVQAAQRAVCAVSQQSKASFIISSTDANVAMSHGIPAITIGGGGEGGGGHTPKEWFKPTKSFLGPQSALLMIVALVGLEGVSEPTLKAR